MVKKPPKPHGRASAPRTKKKSIRELSREYLQKGEDTAALDEVINGPDRTTAILAALHLIDALTGIIRSQFKHIDEATTKELYERDGPLSSFFSMIILAYALGLITEEEKKKLTAIRHIRNTFAHAIRPITFRTPEIVAECQKLSEPDREPITEVNARSAYILTNWAIASRLLDESLSIYRAGKAKH